ncbi:DUF2141 domain-containing protein [Sandaracinus amylolyticus]|uniref:DUF2141 domain-containing protein n=1 Tax=Sandaracinus amylolyticus TaxID=927083 RepID=UPI001F3E48E2|nr:DUF2141 domain-containing protein [Sandaracinus amylolyticus]
MLSAGLFDHESLWLHDGEELAICRSRIVRGRARCRFGGLAPGVYGVAFFHDEDRDGQVDRDWLGIPTEGFGFSNDAPTPFAPPSWSSAALQVRGPVTRARVAVRYGI